MCTNCKMVYNPYIRKRILTSCGKCEACQQEKANARALRIKNNSRFGFIPLFVTLTYKNDFLPFVYRKDICAYKDIPVYRSAKIRHYRSNQIVTDGIHVIDSVWLSDEDLCDVDISKCLSPVKMSSDKIGVICYSDVQDFFKRLRIYFKRKYGYEIEFTYYSCAELGPTTQRPHFHLLLFVRSDDEEKVRSSIVACWPFADPARTKEYIEIAKDASSYVASYVNCSNSLSSFHQTRAFRQKHSYSKGFGTMLDCFSLASLLEKADRQALTYNRVVFKDGIPCITPFPIPKYVINRYFPKFKGYAAVTDDEIRKLLLVPELLSANIKSKNVILSWTVDEVNEWKVRLRNLSDLFVSELGITYDEFWANYADWHIKIWNARFNTVFRMSYDVALDVGWSDFYENINEMFLGLVDSNVSDVCDSFQLDPNARQDYVSSTQNLKVLYYKKDKSRKVVNYAMSKIGHNV